MVNGIHAEWKVCDSLTHQRHIEDFFDLDNFVCKNFQESQHSAADKLEINYPGDNPLEVNENFSQQFQSDIRNKK